LSCEHSRTFSNEFKRQVFKEIFSGNSSTTTAAACRKYTIAYPVLVHWKKTHYLGRLDNEPTSDEDYQGKITQLERTVSQLTMQNYVLKKY